MIHMDLSEMEWLASPHRKFIVGSVLEMTSQSIVGIFGSYARHHMAVYATADPADNDANLTMRSIQPKPQYFGT